MPLNNPIHVQQMAIGYCLPACAQMALAQFGITASQVELTRLLGTRPGVGTPFSQLERLSRFPISIQLAKHVQLDVLLVARATGKAVIAAIITTSGLPGWGNLRTRHAVLLNDVNAERITYHDPALAYGPVYTDTSEFMLAWSEMDEQAALLGTTT